MATTRRTFLSLCAAAGAGSVLGGVARAAPRGLPTEAEIRARTPELWRLVDLINGHRQRHGLPPATLSPRLTAVAALHVKDLAGNRPHEEFGSLHSWSYSDRWRGGAYRADDRNTHAIMWEKPREIAGYPALGFEIACADVLDMREALALWSASPAHNQVMLNRDAWQAPRWRWQALGAAFHRGYACAWFGAASEPPA